MRLLLDTHAFLWFVLNDPQLSGKAMTLMTDPANELLFSPASYWEIAIKVSKGKYQVPANFEKTISPFCQFR
jgi:PIN domain nuclease of toxin-antitoxin system